MRWWRRRRRSGASSAGSSAFMDSAGVLPIACSRGGRRHKSPPKRPFCRTVPMPPQRDAFPRYSGTKNGLCQSEFCVSLF